jgi:hypothetical protein
MKPTRHDFDLSKALKSNRLRILVALDFIAHALLIGLKKPCCALMQLG